MNALRYYSRLVIKITLGILSIPILIIVLIVGYSFANDAQMKVRGYYVMTTGVDLATILVDKHLPASECLLFRNPTFAIMTPSTGEHIQNCIHRYAEMTKDPSACELLMPSSYGLSCVGGALTQTDLCIMNDHSVQWRNKGNDALLEESYTSCLNAKKKRTFENSACCLIAEVAFVRSENDCSSLRESKDFYDECLTSLAFKNGDPTVCLQVSHPNTKMECLVQAKGMQEDPSICSGCKERVQTLNDFK